jgi:hypothetical protein
MCFPGASAHPQKNRAPSRHCDPICLVLKNSCWVKFSGFSVQITQRPQSKSRQELLLRQDGPSNRLNFRQICLKAFCCIRWKVVSGPTDRGSRRLACFTTVSVRKHRSLFFLLNVWKIWPKFCEKRRKGRLLSQSFLSRSGPPLSSSVCSPK